jgi:cell division protein FtsZ
MQAMENALEPLNEILQDVDLTFITVGMGGGTGTGVAPVVAEQAKRQGSLVVSIATTPFEFEKRSRGESARRGIHRLNQSSDMLLLLDNNRLLDIYSNLPVDQAFGVMDQLMSEVIKGLVEAITEPSLVNLDFADLRTIMRQKGLSTILYGESTDPDSVVKDALSNPLLEVDYEGATGAMIHVTGGKGMSLKKAEKVFRGMTEPLDSNANVIFGARVDEKYDNMIRVMAVITGISDERGMEAYEVDEEEELAIVR